MIKYIIIILGLILIHESCFSNEHVITVLKSQDKSPLISATLEIKCIKGKYKDSVIHRRTDRNGRFINPFSEPASVKIRYIGCKDFCDTITGAEPNQLFVEESSIMMQEVVTTGQYVPQSAQKSVYPIKVVTEARIEAQAAPNLRDLLQTETNIRINQDQTLGSSMSINGISGENIKILIDGVSVIGRLDGNIDISQINLNNVERIEIIEGPMSTIYGTDALGGVINIITKNNMKDQFYAYSNNYYESVGTANFDGGLDFKSGANMLSVSGGRDFFGGYSIEDTSRYKSWKPREQYFADLKYSYQFDKFMVRYSGRFFHDLILNRGSLQAPYFETGLDDYYRTDRLTNTLFAFGQIAENQFVDVTASYSYYQRKKNTYFKNLVTLEEKLVDNGNAQDTSDFDSWMIRATYSNDDPASILSYQLGGDFNIESAYGKKFEDGTQFINDYAFFTSVQYKPISTFLIQPALRVQYNSRYDATIDYSASFFNKKLYDFTAPIIPSLNIKYDFDEFLTARFSYGKGFRAPSLKELDFLFVDANHNIQGNDSLKAETSENYNLSLTLNFQGDDYVLRITQSAFYNEISNQITLASINDELYSYANIGTFKTQGRNLSVNYYRDNLTASVAFSHIGRYNSLSEADMFNTPNFVYTPEFSTSIMYVLPFEDIKLNAFYKYTGNLPGFRILTDDNNNSYLQEYTINSYSMADISLAKELFDGLTEFSFGLKNLFNVKDIFRTGYYTAEELSSDGDLRGFPVSWGRTFFVAVKIRIK